MPTSPPAAVFAAAYAAWTDAVRVFDAAHIAWTVTEAAYLKSSGDTTAVAAAVAFVAWTDAQAAYTTAAAAMTATARTITKAK